jgi:Mn-dependent DtxR family transcriptional regulator
MRQLTPSQENYLEWIFRFSQSGPVRLRDLSAKVGVKEPSASRAIAGLVESGLVHHEAYGKIELTEEGRRAGEAIVRRDDCLTRLLVELLGMDPREADAEVHRLEHVLGDEVLARLEVLVAFAASSPAWVRRLQHRIRTEAQTTEGTGGYRIGATHMHAGSSTEKRAENGNELA